MERELERSCCHVRESEVFVVESQLDVQLNCTLFPRVRSWKLTSPRAWPRKGASIDEGPNMCRHLLCTTIHRTLRIHFIISLSSSRSIS